MSRFDGGRLNNTMPSPSQDLFHNLKVLIQRGLVALPFPRPRWISIRLAGSYPARSSPRLFSPLTSLEELELWLEALGELTDLEGILLEFGSLEADWGTLFSLRRLLKRLSQRQQTLAYLEQIRTRELYLASAARTIVAPESAEIELLGFGTKVVFLGELFERLGLRFEKWAIGEYKSFGEELIHKEMGEPQREELNRILELRSEHWVEQVAEGRRRSPEEVRSWLARGLMSGKEAYERGILDELRYPSELPAAVPLSRLRALLIEPYRRLEGPRIGVLSLQGTITLGPSQRLPLLGMSMGSRSVLQILKALEQDRRIAAVVLYVDSGGGSALASDLIGHQIQHLARKKPVVGVMGEVAGSGGYYILSGIRPLIAKPTTLTGSIGVVSLRPVLQELNRRLGRNPVFLNRDPLWGLGDPDWSLSETERQLIQGQLEEVYRRFVGWVAQGRDLEVSQVEAFARGRVWLGPDALRQGLVDELGDLATGLSRAHELAKLPPETPIWNFFPPSPSFRPLGGLSALSQLLREPALLLSPWLLC
jgi:protease-4